MKYAYTIACQSCNAIRSYERQVTDAQLADNEVLALAPHSDDCALEASGNGTISSDASNPANILYIVA